jgi:S-adenosylmethionine:tRNA ribosyltransferase-isomerase
MSLPVSAFDFDLPETLIAQEAVARGRSRLLVVDRSSGRWQDRMFQDLPDILQAGDLLVANDSRVFPARLLGRRVPSGGHVECLLLERLDAAGSEWRALVHPGQKLKPGARVVFEDAERAPGVRLEGEIQAREFFGRRRIRLTAAGAPSVDAGVDAIGHVPLPPYIARADRADDIVRYQTVFARSRGSIAAPTAGLHFDAATLDAVRSRGVGWATVTLHVGYGTFKPVRSEQVEDHVVDPEPFEISAETSDAIAAAKARGGRVIAVGTTTTRALESAARETGVVTAGTGRTDLFIHPGFEFRVVDALLTNFHLPRSSLLMLVAAFAGLDLTLEAYRHAIEARYRFYSYGDAMLVY